MPLPAVIHWMLPPRSSPWLPTLSRCSIAPSIMYVTVSKPRWGWFGKPAM
jgi:hypothetical protein